MPDSTIPVACQNLLHDWANMLDTKSWTRMPTIFAPSIDVDYSDLGHIKATAVPPSFYIDHYSSPNQLGNPEVQSHHFIGACKWTRESESHVRVVFQIMGVHRRTPQDGEVVRATGHGVNTMDLTRVDGEWKIGAIKVTILWMDGDFDAIFAA
ncbi:conidial pigment biosynthesis scytalone dehydratase Arp1 [Aspergillus bombycis]|uniref:Conidial pigment biosynthesis scytalone dehydratase Arp1 n=1 Tax=Aspergillus bombycis TaxID=109264 RepID=A0A1F8A7J3_9EURO|nr:conidial pigment biosynthesis scytalone dehydratase Arp1 [Aspergillus bombycis]OGM47653.1 conidial pigment biosynthesis scytalone dehydratase Arp1 [Aspergillus bombycis]